MHRGNPCSEVIGSRRRRSKPHLIPCSCVFRSSIKGFGNNLAPISGSCGQNQFQNLEKYPVCKVQINPRWTIKSISANTAFLVTFFWEDKMISIRSFQRTLRLSKRVSQFIFDGGSRHFRPSSTLPRLSQRFGGQPRAITKAVPGPVDVWRGF